MNVKWNTRCLNLPIMYIFINLNTSLTKSSADELADSVVIYLYVSSSNLPEVYFMNLRTKSLSTMTVVSQV